MITLIHGFLGSPSDWNPLIKHLNQPCRCLTLPGHHDQSLDWDDFENTIGDAPILIGYSMGARLAMHYALKNPLRVKHTIILSGNPGESGASRLNNDEQWASLLENQGIDFFLKKWYDQPLFQGFKRAPNTVNHNPKQLAQAMRIFSPARLPNLWPFITNFICKTTFIFGQNDYKYQHIGKRLMNKNQSVFFIPNSAHAIHIESPRACAHHILSEANNDY